MVSVDAIFLGHCCGAFLTWNAEMTFSCEVPFDRAWLLTWTTYGSWLPGDDRGFVSNAWNGSETWRKRNRPGTPYDCDLPIQERRARQSLVGDPVRLTQPQAEKLLPQLLETASCRRWHLLAVAIMANHCHVVVGVPGDPSSESILRDFKSYGSRCLTHHFRRPASGTWWTASGSKRKLNSNTSVLGAILYVIQQEYALVIWTAKIPELMLPGGRLRHLEGRAKDDSPAADERTT